MNKTNKKIKWLCSVLLPVFLAAVTGCGKAEETAVSFHTELQENYLNDTYDNYKVYANGTEELSKPLPVTVSADSSDTKLYISEYEDFSAGTDYMVKDGKTEIYNLKIHTKYYIKHSGKEEASVSYLVTDSLAPRNLFVEGVTNIRDVGGWTREEGGYVKQGLLYRSSKFNKDESTELLVTEEGIKTLTEDLLIKTEIDLRTVDDNENGGITKSPLGDGVTYYSVPLKSGGNIILLNKDKLPELFEILGNEDNYPVVFHCSIGTDRTGMLAFLVNALMGVSEEDLYRDFLFSNFGNIGKLRTPSIIETYMDTVDMASGENLSEKVYNYLVGAGVKAEDIDSLKKILSE
ncbi:MAG: tyrosine-protein phosphatase [Lachnospiraceae bacterium]|nr:tyrosine-protein phosphatase [Lachnospiraceae bacterium]